MNKLKYLLYLAFAGLMLPLTSCEDPDLNPYLEPETAVHGLGAFSSGSPTSFKVGDMNTPVKFDLQWISIDSKNTVTKIEVFVTYTEKYIDPEKKPAYGQPRYQAHRHYRRQQRASQPQSGQLHDLARAGV